MKLLDLYAGAGGASVGYHRAGFDVTGVDITPHPDYPYPLIVADALTVLAAPAALLGFDAIHASPPCQSHTTMSNRWRGKGGRADSHVDLIPETRRLLDESGLPYVLENVPGARSSLRDPLTLTGGMFGLAVERPRLFELHGFAVMLPAHRRVTDPIGVYGRHHDGRRLWTRADGTEQRAARTLEQARLAMGIDWMSWADLTEAIPPAYTEHIGGFLIDHLIRSAAA